MSTSSAFPFAAASILAARDDGVAWTAEPTMSLPSSDQPTSPENREAIDAALIERMAAGDKAALAELYDRFSGPLYGIALRIVHEPAEAQDLVHDVFIALWDKATTFNHQRGTAFAWAVTSVRNRAIDRVRMRRRRAELLAQSVPGDLGLDDAHAQPSAVDAAASGDDAQAVRAAVATLPPEQQRALELAYFGGLTQEEIAKKLREPLGTIKARIRRGLLKLRDSLARRV